MGWRSIWLLNLIVVYSTSGLLQSPLLKLSGFQMPPSKPVLLDAPVSPAGARCRFIIYTKGIEQSVDIMLPSVLGGLKTPEYLKVNPEGKMPSFICEDGSCFGESDTIARYLVDRFAESTPTFLPATLKDRTLANSLARHHDIYLMPLQGSLYKLAPPYSAFSSRLDAQAELKKQLGILENMASADGPYLAGSELSLADASVFPTFVFFTYMFPKFGVEQSEYMGPKISKWWEFISSSPVGSRIRGEIEGALNAWNDNKRWEGILHAGVKDTAAETIFDRIIRKEIPSTVVFEDDKVLAFRDINPVAPTHVLIIPKVREGLTQLRHATAEHVGVLGHILEVAAKIANDEKLSGFRVVINDGADGGQEVFHLHAHLIGGRKLKWPPG